MKSTESIFKGPQNQSAPNASTFSLQQRINDFLFFYFFLLGTQPYKETCGDKHKTRHRGCRNDVPMYREQLDRPGVSALALQPGIEKKGGGCMVR